MTDKLLPCPFCGGDGLVIQSKSATALWAVHCKNCDAGPSASLGRKEAVETWNTRQFSPATIAAAVVAEMVSQPPAPNALSRELRKRADHLGLLMVDPPRPHPDADLLRRAADALDNASCAPSANLEGWQPIATAPTDGTRILFLSKMFRDIGIGFYRDRHIWTGNFAYQPSAIEREWSDIASHWMPLPPLPDAETQA